AALREMKRGGKARIARAHNADIGRLVMIEPAEFRCVLDCRGIIGKGVGGLFHRSSSRTLLRGSGDLEYRFLVAVRMDFVQVHAGFPRGRVADILKRFGTVPCRIGGDCLAVSVIQYARDAEAARRRAVKLALQRAAELADDVTGLRCLVAEQECDRHGILWKMRTRIDFSEWF